MKPVQIWYHANCLDGTGAKYAAWKKFGDTADYTAVFYSKPAPAVDSSVKEVYILDFSYSREELEAIREKGVNVTVLDHHKTAEAALQGLSYATFDMNKSGAVMAWEYFFPEEPVPSLLHYVQDRDLWKFHLFKTEEVMSAVKLFKGNLGKWDAYRNSTQELIKTGEIIVEYQNNYVDSVVKNNVSVIDWKGLKAGITNCTTLVSEIGNEICKSTRPNVDLAIVYCITPDNSVLLSFRSQNTGDVDVSVFAGEFGGGGHKHAAGAKVSLEKLMEILNGKYGKH